LNTLDDRRTSTRMINTFYRSGGHIIVSNTFSKPAEI